MEYKSFTTYIFIKDHQVEIDVTVLMTATRHSSLVKVEHILNLDTCEVIELNSLSKDQIEEINIQANDFLFECEPELRAQYEIDLIDQKNQDRLDFERGK